MYLHVAASCPGGLGTRSKQLIRFFPASIKTLPPPPQKVQLTLEPHGFECMDPLMGTFFFDKFSPVLSFLFLMISLILFL